VSSKVLYYYLPADSPKYLEFSPAILIIKSMYEYSQKHCFEILDLGISTYLGERNEGLIRFKKNLGGMESEKNTFIKIME
jgi:lipid II:glycine glycyltransferase (peptidoglycan interpeptide bridge formation enzyme)